MKPEQRRFIDDFAALMIHLGMPPAVARLYGYLMLAPAPVSLDQMSEELEASKSNVSVAARLLEKHQLARRHAERGSKRALYSVTDDYTGLFAEKSAVLGKLAVLLRDGAGMVGDRTAARRLEAISDYHVAMKHAMEVAAEQFKSGE
ncbi:MAG TPA: hypothetical protein VIK82_08565 [Porticoccaceae bacterium]